MSKLVTWLKQLLTELNNIQMQRRLDKLWEAYMEEEHTWGCIPVVSREVQQHTAAELTAKMWAEIAAANVLERIRESGTNQDGSYRHIGMVVKKKNIEKLDSIVKRYPTAWRYL